MARQDDVVRKLLPLFQVEAEERVQTMRAALDGLRGALPAAQRTAVIESLMREAHGLKGAALAVQLGDLAALCKSVEIALGLVTRGQSELTPLLMDTVRAAVESLPSLAAAPAAAHGPQARALIERLAASSGATVGVVRPEAPATPDTPVPDMPAAVQAEAPRPPAAPAPEMSVRRESGVETIRVATDTLDRLYRQAEEMLTLKLTADQRVTDLRDIAALVDAWRAQWARIDLEVRRVQRALPRRPVAGEDGPAPAATLSDFLDWSWEHLKLLDGKVQGLAQAVDQERQTVGRMVDTLLDDARKLLLLPAAWLLDGVSRDAAPRLQNVDLVVEGGDVEVDKRILDALTEPLQHLVQNALDHGVSAEPERTARGKPPRLTIRVSVRRAAGNRVEVSVSDDGGGVDAARVRAVAVRAGAVTGEQAARLGVDEAVQLILTAGVSTKPGRRPEAHGGLASVREQVQALGGHVTLTAVAGHGTSVRLVVPQTLATFRGVLIDVADQSFIIPTAHVERVVRLPREQVQVAGEHESVTVHGERLDLIRLDAALGIERAPVLPPSDSLLLVVAVAGSARAAFAIDAFVSEQEVLFKDLGTYLSAVRQFAGATLLGSGRVVLILSVADVIQLSRVADQSAGRSCSAAPVGKRILVAEDSLTSRMLLKEILEAAGYQVATAVDGADAVSTLNERQFDLIVSDIEMPRMNGFELTQRVRNHPEYKEVPVILVTGLESREDRERGLGLGASAYIVKSRFDQSHLLDTIQRLL